MRSSSELDCQICRFVIGREKPGEQSEVAQLIQQTLEQERWQREMMEQRYNQYMDEQEVSLWEAGGLAAEHARAHETACSVVLEFVVQNQGCSAY